jgi:hypothetical protein
MTCGSCLHGFLHGIWTCVSYIVECGLVGPVPSSVECGLVGPVCVPPWECGLVGPVIFCAHLWNVDVLVPTYYVLRVFLDAMWTCWSYTYMCVPPWNMDYGLWARYSSSVGMGW